MRFTAQAVNLSPTDPPAGGPLPGVA